MPSLKDIKKRISSVKNTQKITKAMKMVAAAKLRRAQHAVMEARAYSENCEAVLSRVLARAAQTNHPLLVTRENVKKKKLWIFSSDRGLCGGFNSNLLRQVDSYLKEETGRGLVIDSHLFGKKSRDFYSARKLEYYDIQTDIYDNINHEYIHNLALTMIDFYKTSQTDQIVLVFNKFKSALTQVINFQTVLPLGGAIKKEAASNSQVDYLYEPEKTELIEKLCVECLSALINQAFLETKASEMGARMTAMDSATSNASDMISLLSLQYNRARQANITKDLLDIVNGAEALG